MTDQPETHIQHLTALRQQILAHCDLEEFHTLCADLGVNYDKLRGEGLKARVRELVALLHRLGRLPDGLRGNAHSGCWPSTSR